MSRAQQRSGIDGILDHHLKCIGEGNLEGILAHYSSDAVLFLPTGPLKGPDALKPVFQAMISELGKPAASCAMHQKYVEGDYAYILWKAQTQTIATTLRRIHLLCGTEKSSRNLSLRRLARSAEPDRHHTFESTMPSANVGSPICSR